MEIHFGVLLSYSQRSPVFFLHVINTSPSVLRMRADLIATIAQKISYEIKSENVLKCYLTS